jgi:hypothetical protein
MVGLRYRFFMQPVSGKTGALASSREKGRLSPIILAGGDVRCR